MHTILKKIIGDVRDKKEWNAMEARAKALPPEYRVVYSEIKRYLWSGAGPLDSAMEVFKGLLELFEEGAAHKRPVLDITGEDVAAFCDELVRGEKTYIVNLREKLNRNIANKLGT